jgi:hypothetical protein
VVVWGGFVGVRVDARVGIMTVAGGFVGVSVTENVGLIAVVGGAVGIVWCLVLARPIGNRKESHRIRTSIKDIESLSIWLLRFVRILVIFHY